MHPQPTTEHTPIRQFSRYALVPFPGDGCAVRTTDWPQTDVAYLRVSAGWTQALVDEFERVVNR